MENKKSLAITFIIESETSLVGSPPRALLEQLVSKVRILEVLKEYDLRTAYFKVMIRMMKTK